MSGWQLPNITLRWGAYFKPDPADDLVLVQLTAQASEAGLITKRMAMQKLQSTFDIENVDQALETLEEEAEQRKQDALDQSGAELEQMHALSANLANGGPSKRPGARAAGQANKKAPASSGSGSAKPADK